MHSRILVVASESGWLSPPVPPIAYCRHIIDLSLAMIQYTAAIPELEGCWIYVNNVMRTLAQ